jgi:hypothetical protein
MTQRYDFSAGEARLFEASNFTGRALENIRTGEPSPVAPFLSKLQAMAALSEDSKLTFMVAKARGNATLSTLV